MAARPLSYLGFSITELDDGFGAQPECAQSNGSMDLNPVKFDMFRSPIPAYGIAADGLCRVEEPDPNFHPSAPLGFHNSCINSNGGFYSHSELNTSPTNQAVANSAQAPNLQQLLISDHPTSYHSPLSPNPQPSSSLIPPPSRNVLHSGIQKRKPNTLAARKYRQKRLDLIRDLEAALKQSQIARDALKIRAARLEGEVEVLRRLVVGGGTTALPRLHCD